MVLAYDGVAHEWLILIEDFATKIFKQEEKF